MRILPKLKYSMQHLQQVFELHRWTPFKILETSFANSLQSNCPILLNFLKNGLSNVNSKIMHAVGRKEAIAASSAIGLGAFLIFELTKKLNKSAIKQSEEHQNKAQSHSDKSSEPQNEQSDLPKWLREKGDSTLEQILEVSKQESTCGDNVDNDKVFFEVYNAYLQAQQ